MSSKPQTTGLSALLRKEKERKAREEQEISLQTDKRIKLKDAASYLNVSPRIVSRLVKEGSLNWERDLLDKRIKLVRLEELDKLKQASLSKH